MLKAPPIVLTALLLTLVLLEFLILPTLDTAGMRTGARWIAEDKKILQLSTLRNLATNTNAVWRSELHGPKKLAGHPRILVVGDSFVWGDGYANCNDLWWRILERELHRRGYQDAEVCAVGQCGISMGNAIAPAQRAIEQLKPDIIVWSYIPNNANEQLSQRPLMSTLEMITEQFKASVPQLCAWLKTTVAERFEEMISWDHGDSKDPHQWEKKLLGGENFARLKNTMCRLADLFTIYDRPAVVVLLPTMPVVGYNEERFKPIKDFLSLINVNFLDLSEGYVDWFRNERTRYWNAGKFQLGDRILWINPANAHPSATLGQYYSVSLAKYLTRSYPKYFKEAIVDSSLETDTSKSPNIEINDCMPPCSILELLKINGGYQLQIPNNEAQLSLPLDRPFVQLNLREPKRIFGITIRGVNLRTARIVVSTENSEFKRDIGELRDLGKQTAQPLPNELGVLTWKLSLKEPVNTVRLADLQFCNSGKRKLEIFFRTNNCQTGDANTFSPAQSVN